MHHDFVCLYIDSDGLVVFWFLPFLLVQIGLVLKHARPGGKHFKTKRIVLIFFSSLTSFTLFWNLLFI